MKGFLLRIYCATYNHAPYITNAFDGFVMQQTDFPFVCNIVDDASIDGAQDVIRAYLIDNFDLNDVASYDKDMDYGHVTFARHKTNKNCYFAVLYLKENHFVKGKSKVPYLEEWMDTRYIAICEGDDYWVDPNKLQKQVAFLESHPDFSMCFHRALIKNEAAAPVITTCDKIETKEYFTKDIFPGWVIPTASVIYRKKMIDEYPSLKHPEWVKYGDIVMFLKCTHTGRVWGMEDVMSVYRMTNNGAVLKQRKESGYMERLCRHYECLMLNFPQIDRQWANGFIAQYYYSKMRHSKRVSDVFHGLWKVVKHKPKLLVGKLIK